MLIEGALVNVVIAIVAAVGGSITTLATIKRDKHLNHASIVEEYRKLVETHTDEIRRLQERVVYLETQLAISTKKLQEVEDCYHSCRYKARKEVGIS